MSDQFQQQYYETESFWADDALTDPANRRRYDETVQLVPEDVSTLADIGCGNGVFGRVLQHARPDLRSVGVDRSAAALAHVTIPRLRADLARLPLADRAVDCVSCLEVIEHLPVGAFEHALAELARVSARFIVIGVPYDEDIARDNYTVCPRCRTRFNRNLHLQSFTRATMDGLFDEHRFRAVRSVYPGSATRLKGIGVPLEVQRRRKMWSNRNEFRSPLCPVCGYREDDGGSSKEGVRHRPAPVGARSRADSARAALRPVLSRWPREYVPGYWIATLYERA